MKVRVVELNIQNFKDIKPGEVFVTDDSKKKYFIATDYEENGGRGVVELETGRFHMFRLNNRFKVVDASLDVVLG